MIAIVKSTVLNGLDGQIVKVEVDVSSGLPGFEIEGLYSRCKAFIKYTNVSVVYC